MALPGYPNEPQKFKLLTPGLGTAPWAFGWKTNCPWALYVGVLWPYLPTGVAHLTPPHSPGPQHVLQSTQPHHFGSHGKKVYICHLGQGLALPHRPPALGHRRRYGWGSPGRGTAEGAGGRRAGNAQGWDTGGAGAQARGAVGQEGPGRLA